MFFAVVVCLVVAWGYWMCNGRLTVTKGGVLGFLIGGLGILAAYDGATLAVGEFARMRNGRVIPGVVLAKSSSTRADGSGRVPLRRARRYRYVTLEGFRVHDVLERLILTGSGNAWIVDYRYPCDRDYGCRGRDFVPEPLWRRLSVGQTVNVRETPDASDPVRLDENPQWAAAIVDLGTAAALLLVAGLVSGRFTVPRRGPRYARPVGGAGFSATRL